ncbi:hypothetical protein E1262_08725 [Jiangella aurantiaca]|uniref:Phthiocerol/phthiodiolone dimycocerosyl transferase n=1 Tax=Jiangella aurantiaca TaxID=2530373 RepID=A0A4R5AE18_9ACTN|nr:hypothetical protein [Jiangella aurantiaca]TDD70723.1 hypothetical protein E1262_08725 [Jiangella aurantiaca]
MKSELAGTSPLRRNLDHIESRGLGYAPTKAARFSGHIDPEALESAFQLLQWRYPLLAARVLHVGDQQILEVPAGHVASIRVITGGSEQLWDYVGEPWDPANGVAKVTLIADDDGGYVALRADHSIIDGRSWDVMFDDFWDIYARITEDEALPEEPRGQLPLPPTHFIERAFGADALNDVRAIKGSTVRTRIHQGRIDFGPDETRAVRAAARARDTTVHAMICGAIMIAQRAFADPDPESLPMACLTVVDFRQLIDPPIKPTDTTCFVHTSKADIDVAPDSDAFELGQNIKTQLVRSIGAPRELLAFSATSYLASLDSGRVEDRLRVAYVTNTGVLPTARHPRNARIVDYEKGLLPESASIFPAYQVYTYGGRLTIRHLYPSDAFDAQQVTALTEAIRKELTRILP